MNQVINGGVYRDRKGSTGTFEDTNSYLKVTKDNGILPIGVMHRYNRNSLVDCYAIVYDE